MFSKEIGLLLTIVIVVPGGLLVGPIVYCWRRWLQRHDTAK